MGVVIRPVRHCSASTPAQHIILHTPYNMSLLLIHCPLALLGMQAARLHCVCLLQQAMDSSKPLAVHSECSSSTRPPCTAGEMSSCSCNQCSCARILVMLVTHISKQVMIVTPVANVGVQACALCSPLLPLIPSLHSLIAILCPPPPPTTTTTHHR